MFRRMYRSRAALLCGATVAITGFAAPSAASADGSIEGTVTDEASNALSSVCVSAMGPGFSSAQTDPSGAYTLTGLPAGNYRVQFQDCGSRGLISEYYNDKAFFNADQVPVSDGQVTSGIDAALAQGAEISGNVRDENDDPLDQICVNASEIGGSGFGFGQTNADGDYVVGGLSAGAYRVSFSDCGGRGYITESYDDTRDFNAATPVATTAGSPATGIDAVLAQGGSISGSVTDAQGAPVPFTCIAAYPVSGGPSIPGSTNFTGSYNMTGLTPGEYVVSFSDCPDPYLQEWWDDAPTRAEADVVTVVAGGTASGVNASLREGGRITGTVTGPGGNGESQICVSAEQPQPGGETSVGGSTQTQPDGTYVLTGLYSGDYIVRFQACGGQNLVTEHWDDVLRQNDADLVTVTAEQTTSGIDASLAAGATISGRVTNENGQPLEGVCVQAIRPYAGGADQTNANGEYEIDRLWAGDYRVSFQSCGSIFGSPLNYLQEYYDDARFSADADSVTVATGEQRSGIDAELSPAGSIEGRVTDPDGDPIEGICVNTTAIGLQDEQFGFTQTDSSGTYSVPGLSTGDHRVQFSDCRPGGPEFATEYHDNASRGGAMLVAVTEPNPTTGIDAQLEPGATISGTVSQPGGGPAVTVCVSAFDETATGLYDYEAAPQGDATAGDGTYEIRGLRAGTYKVQFRDCGGGVNQTWWANEFHADEVGLQSADGVTVSAGGSADVDAAIALGGRIEGRVTVGGERLGGVCVLAEDPGTGDEIARGSAGADGRYRLRGVPAGDWAVHFFTGDCPDWFEDSEFADAYYDGAADRAGATPVTVTAEQTTGGIDANLIADTPPETTIASGPSGTSNRTDATFALRSSEPGSSFECRLDGGAFASCGSPVPYSGLAQGSHTFEVRAIDSAGLADPTPATRTWTVNTSSTSQTTSGEVEPGGTVSTDAGGNGPSAALPTTAAVTTPVGGEVTIVSAPAGAPPAGLTFLGRQFEITADPASVAEPLELTFRLDSSAIPGGTDPQTVQVLRDGAAAGNCAGDGTATPDPCVASRTSLGDGDLEITVLSAHASRWNLAVALPPPAGKCRVPLLIARTLANATTALTQAKCKLGTVSTVKTRLLPPNIVLLQKPLPWSVKPVNFAVDVVVTKRP